MMDVKFGRRVPEPGTIEAIEFGCTCRVIALRSATDEAEPAGMLMVTDANCPLHSIAARTFLRRRGIKGRRRRGGDENHRSQPIRSPAGQYLGDLAAHRMSDENKVFHV